MKRSFEIKYLSDQVVAIFGLGLMGGSIALALHGKCGRLIGVEPDPVALDLAEKLAIFDQLTADPSRIILQADLIILAAPVRAIIQLIDQLPFLHTGSPVIIDLGSTKEEICIAMQELPERFSVIGGHPICGKETGGLVHADPKLYFGAPFVLTPIMAAPVRARTDSKAENFALQVVEAVGANPIWLDPKTHDRLIAATSHVPYLIANALAYSTPEDAARLIGPGFQSTARLAPTPRPMIIDILITNHLNVIEQLKVFREHIEVIEMALKLGDFSQLQDYLAIGALRYDQYTRKPNPKP